MRLGRQDLVDPALPDHGVHLPAEAGVGQKLEDVEPAHAGAVHQVLALATAVEPAHHGHLAELERQGGALVVEDELDLAHARGRPAVGAAEEDIEPVGARSCAGDCTAIAHWSASAMFDLPLPFGPTTTAIPARSAARRCRGTT